MPVKTNPGDIKTGAGIQTPESGKDIVLIGAGMAGTPPEIGQPGYIPPDEALGDARPGLPVDEKLENGGGGNLSDHILACSGAHTAAAIDYDPRPPLIQSRNVQGPWTSSRASSPASRRNSAGTFRSASRTT